MLKLTDVEKRVVELLAELLKAGTVNTEAIKIGLCRLGRENGCAVGAKGIAKNERDYGEWLYDVSWAKPQEWWTGFTDQPLVLESELSNVDPKVDHDFQKLMQAKAGTHVWVASIKNLDDADGHILRCLSAVKAFNPTVVGDRYLLVAYYENRSRMVAVLYVHGEGASQVFGEDQVRLAS